MEGSGFIGDSASADVANDGPGFTSGLLAGGIAGGLLGNSYAQRNYGTTPSATRNQASQDIDQDYPQNTGLCGGSQLAKLFFTLAWLSLLSTILGAVLTPKPGTKLSHVLAGDRVLLEVDQTWYESLFVGKKTLVDTYVFVGEQPAFTRVDYNMTVKPSLPAGGKRGVYHFTRFDLYEGSTMHLQYSFTDYNILPFFTLLKGATEMEAFERTGLGEKGVILRKQSAEVKDFTYKTQERNAYFFIWSTKDARAYAKDGVAKVRVQSRTFSTKNAVAKCSAGEDCEIKHLPKAKIFLLFVAPLPDSRGNANYDEASEYPIDYELKARKSSWFEEFLPLGMMIMGSYLLYKHFSKTNEMPPSESYRSVSGQEYSREASVPQVYDSTRIYPAVGTREAGPLPSKAQLSQSQETASAPPPYNPNL
jgi:hypothetical protein